MQHIAPITFATLIAFLILFFVEIAAQPTVDCSGKNPCTPGEHITYIQSLANHGRAYHQAHTHQALLHGNAKSYMRDFNDATTAQSLSLWYADTAGYLTTDSHGWASGYRTIQVRLQLSGAYEGPSFTAATEPLPLVRGFWSALQATKHHEAASSVLEHANGLFTLQGLTYGGPIWDYTHVVPPDAWVYPNGRFDMDPYALTMTIEAGQRLCGRFFSADISLLTACTTHAALVTADWANALDSTSESDLHVNGKPVAPFMLMPAPSGAFGMLLHDAASIDDICETDTGVNTYPACDFRNDWRRFSALFMHDKMQWRRIAVPDYGMILVCAPTGTPLDYDVDSTEAGSAYAGFVLVVTQAHVFLTATNFYRQLRDVPSLADLIAATPATMKVRFSMPRSSDAGVSQYQVSDNEHALLVDVYTSLVGSAPQDSTSALLRDATVSWNLQPFETKGAVSDRHGVFYADRYLTSEGLLRRTGSFLATASVTGQLLYNVDTHRTQGCDATLMSRLAASETLCWLKAMYAGVCTFHAQPLPRASDSFYDTTELGLVLGQYQLQLIRDTPATGHWSVPTSRTLPTAVLQVFSVRAVTPHTTGGRDTLGPYGVTMVQVDSASPTLGHLTDLGVERWSAQQLPSGLTTHTAVTAKVIMHQKNTEEAISRQVLDCTAGLTMTAALLDAVSAEPSVFGADIENTAVVCVTELAPHYTKAQVRAIFGASVASYKTALDLLKGIKVDKWHEPMTKAIEALVKAVDGQPLRDSAMRRLYRTAVHRPLLVGDLVVQLGKTKPQFPTLSVTASLDAMQSYGEVVAKTVHNIPTSQWKNPLISKDAKINWRQTPRIAAFSRSFARFLAFVPAIGSVLEFTAQLLLLLDVFGAKEQPIVVDPATTQLVLAAPQSLDGYLLTLEFAYMPAEHPMLSAKHERSVSMMATSMSWFCATMALCLTHYIIAAASRLSSRMRMFFGAWRLADDAAHKTCGNRTTTTAGDVWDPNAKTCDANIFGYEQRDTPARVQQWYQQVLNSALLGDLVAWIKTGAFDDTHAHAYQQELTIGVCSDTTRQRVNVPYFMTDAHYLHTVMIAVAPAPRRAPLTAMDVLASSQQAKRVTAPLLQPVIAALDSPLVDSASMSAISSLFMLLGFSERAEPSLSLRRSIKTISTMAPELRIVYYNLLVYAQLLKGNERVQVSDTPYTLSTTAQLGVSPSVIFTNSGRITTLAGTRQVWWLSTASALLECVSLQTLAAILNLGCSGQFIEHGGRNVNDLFIARSEPFSFVVTDAISAQDAGRRRELDNYTSADVMALITVLCNWTDTASDYEEALALFIAHNLKAGPTDILHGCSQHTFSAVEVGAASLTDWHIARSDYFGIKTVPVFADRAPLVAAIVAMRYTFCAVITTVLQFGGITTGAGGAYDITDGSSTIIAGVIKVLAGLVAPVLACTSVTITEHTSLAARKYFDELQMLASRPTPVLGPSGYDRVATPLGMLATLGIGWYDYVLIYFLDIVRLLGWSQQLVLQFVVQFYSASYARKSLDSDNYFDVLQGVVHTDDQYVEITQQERARFVGGLQPTQSHYIRVNCADATALCRVRNMVGLGAHAYVEITNDLGEFRCVKVLDGERVSLEQLLNNIAAAWQLTHLNQVTLQASKPVVFRVVVASTVVQPQALASYHSWLTEWTKDHTLIVSGRTLSNARDNGDSHDQSPADDEDDSHDSDDHADSDDGDEGDDKADSSADGDEVASVSDDSEQDGDCSEVECASSVTSVEGAPACTDLTLLTTGSTRTGGQSESQCTSTSHHVDVPECVTPPVSLAPEASQLPTVALDPAHCDAVVMPPAEHGGAGVGASGAVEVDMDLCGADATDAVQTLRSDVSDALPCTSVLPPIVEIEDVVERVHTPVESVDTDVSGCTPTHTVSPPVSTRAVTKKTKAATTVSAAVADSAGLTTVEVCGMDVDEGSKQGVTPVPQTGVRVLDNTCAGQWVDSCKPMKPMDLPYDKQIYAITQVMGDDGRVHPGPPGMVQLYNEPGERIRIAHEQAQPPTTTHRGGPLWLEGRLQPPVVAQVERTIKNIAFCKACAKNGKQFVTSVSGGRCTPRDLVKHIRPLYESAQSCTKCRSRLAGRTVRWHLNHVCEIMQVGAMRQAAVEFNRVIDANDGVATDALPLLENFCSASSVHARTMSNSMSCLEPKY